MRALEVRLFALMLLMQTALAWGCNAEDNRPQYVPGQGVSGQSGTVQGVCTAGFTQECYCADGQKGTHVCLGDGSGYSFCQCASGAGTAGNVAGAGGPGGAGAGAGGSGGSAGDAAGAAGEAGSGGAAGQDMFDGGGQDDGGGGFSGSAGADSSTPDQNEVPATAYCAPVASWDSTWSAWEEEVLRLVNERRAAGADCGTEGVFGAAGPLTMNANLRCSARLHSKDMADNNYFDHYALDGTDPFQRMAAAGYSGNSMGENIASGQTSPTEVMDGWMQSDGHCSNIMSPLFNEIGVGYYEIAGSTPWDTARLWTQNFGGSGWGG